MDPISREGRRHLAYVASLSGTTSLSLLVIESSSRGLVYQQLRSHIPSLFWNKSTTFTAVRSKEGRLPLTGAQ